MEVDGPDNTVLEVDTEAPPPGPDNPYGNVFYQVERSLTHEQEAQRDVDFSRMRYWRIVNPQKKNWVGKPTGYKLEPTSAVRPFTHPDSPSGRRGRFIQHQLWVTAYDPAQRFPAGEFVNQSDGGDGLKPGCRRTGQSRDTDIVLWHSFGLHHLPRPEDHPVQPCISCGFTLMPSGFFDQNPVIDLPPGKNMKSCHAKS